ncbi:MAG: Ig-like domain-containing protein [Spirochaetia bacterium]|nr:Ig-like domain-containing protein [Spirochaetia bacterium]
MIIKQNLKHSRFALLYMTISILITCSGTSTDDLLSGKFGDRNPELEFDELAIELNEGGASATVGVYLTERPDSDVILNLTAPTFDTLGKTYEACTPFDLTITPSQIVFTPDNFNEKQTISIAYPDNNCVHKTLFYGIQFENLVSDDELYNNLVVPALKVVVLEDFGTDATPIAIALDPYDGQTDLPPDQTFIRVHFNKDMDASTITTASFTIEETGSSPIKHLGSFAWYDANKKDAYLSFKNYLVPLVNYTVRLSGNIKDSHGNSLNNALETEYTFKSKIWGYEEISVFDTEQSARDVVIIGDYAYVADAGAVNYGLRVINISNPAAPFLAASYNTISSPLGVAVSGNHAYVAMSQFGVEVINISNQNCGTPPCALTQESVYIMPDPNLNTNGITISGNYLFAANSSAGIQILNIQDPSALTLAASYDTPGYARNTAVNGIYAYIADQTSGLQVINISNLSCGTPPCTLTPESSILTSTEVYNVKIDSGYAYLASGNTGLQIVNISDPSQPSLVSVFDTENSVSEVNISGSYAYLVDGVGLKTFDISDAAKPLLVGKHDTAGSAMGIQIVGDYAYIADNALGLRITDISQLTSPYLTATFVTPGSANDLSIAGNYAFVADSGSGVSVIDISNPNLPILAASFFEADNYTRNIVVSGNYAYAANGWFGLTVLDITNLNCDTMPCSLSKIASLPTSNQTISVVIKENYAYLADGTSGLKVVDITEPAQPVEAALYDTPGTAYSITLNGNYAYVADISGGLQVIDITDPLVPELAAYYDTPGDAYNVDIIGNYAYVSDAASGIQIIELSNLNCGSPPCLLNLANNFSTLGNAYDVEVNGNYAYVAIFTSGIQILDISNPALPVHVDSLDTTGYARNLEIKGSYAYIAGADSGLQTIFLGPHQPQ